MSSLQQRQVVDEGGGEKPRLAGGLSPMVAFPVASPSLTDRLSVSAKGSLGGVGGGRKE